jgi:hypothetical protein
MLIRLQFKKYIRKPPILHAKYNDCVRDYDKVVKDKQYLKQ